MQAPQKAAPPSTVKVLVLRAFQKAGGEVVPAKAEIVLPRAFALELAHAKKVQLIEEAKPAPTPPAKEEKSLFNGGRKEK